MSSSRNGATRGAPSGAPDRPVTQSLRGSDVTTSVALPLLNNARVAESILYANDIPCTATSFLFNHSMFASQDKCTFTHTKDTHTMQPWKECFTCSIINNSVSPIPNSLSFLFILFFHSHLTSCVSWFI